MHDFALPVTHESDDAGCVDFITKNLLLRTDDISTTVAANMTRLVREKFDIDNYMKRAWYINPGYQWPAPPGAPVRDILLPTDKMIVVAVVSMRNVKTGVVTSRRSVCLIYPLFVCFRLLGCVECSQGSFED